LKNLRSYEDFLVEYKNYIRQTSIDNPEGSITNVLGEEDVDEYMFFQNLKTIRDSVSMMLSLDPKAVNALLKDGHAWAVDHISTSKDDVEEVAGFLKGRLSESVSEGKTTDFNRILAMTPAWWIAWQDENKDKGYEIKKDAFSKTYEISKDDKVLFVYDYSRNKVFTNENPQSFVIDNNMSQEEFDEIKKKAEGLTKATPKIDSNEPQADQGTEDTEEADADTKNSDTEEE
jgi:hypothetical protein